MGPNFYRNICRIVLSTLLFFSIIPDSYSQNSDRLNFTYQVDSMKVGSSYKYAVQISVTEGESPFIYELCNKSIPLGGKSLIKSEITTELQYTFSDLELKEYYVYVYSSSKQISRGKRILIK